MMPLKAISNTTWGQLSIWGVLLAPGASLLSRADVMLSNSLAFHRDTAYNHQVSKVKSKSSTNLSRKHAACCRCYWVSSRENIAVGTEKQQLQKKCQKFP